MVNLAGDTGIKIHQSTFVFGIIRFDQRAQPCLNLKPARMSPSIAHGVPLPHQFPVQDHFYQITGVYPNNHHIVSYIEYSCAKNFLLALCVKKIPLQ